MTPFKLDAIARRHQAVHGTRPARRPVRTLAIYAPTDSRANPLFRGLLHGVPIGLAMWLILGTLLWAIA